MYRYYNANPKGLLTDDCVLRSISVAEGISWNDCQKKLSYLSGKQGLLLNDLTFVEDYLDNLYPRKCYRDMTIGEFSKICPKGHFYEATFGNFRNGFRCPQCHKISKGERAIQQFLEKAKIEYRFQYTFKECKNIIALPFDFYIPKFCTCIEYDGEQHFMPVTFGGISKKRADIKFKQVQLRDEIKNKYCLDNNIRLIRIPYWNFDKIEEILLKELDV